MFWDWGVVADVGAVLLVTAGLAVWCLTVWSWKSCKNECSPNPQSPERGCVYPAEDCTWVHTYIDTSSDCWWSSSESLCMLRHAVNDRGDPELYSGVVLLFLRWPGIIDNALKKTYWSARRCICHCPVPRAFWTLYLTLHVFCSSTRQTLSFPVSPYTCLLQALSAMKRTLAVRAGLRKIFIACI